MAHGTPSLIPRLPLVLRQREILSGKSGDEAMGHQQSGFLLVRKAANYPPGTFPAIYQPQKTEKWRDGTAPFESPRVKGGHPPLLPRRLLSSCGQKTAYTLEKAQKDKEIGEGHFTALKGQVGVQRSK